MANPFKKKEETPRFPSITESLEKNAMSMGEGLRGIRRENVPLVPQPYPYPQPVPQKRTAKIPPQVVYNQEDPIVSKIKRWLLIGLSALIGGLAIVLIIWRLIFKFT